MSYVGEPYSHDVFVIYSNAVEDKHGETLVRWSQGFVRELESELRCFPDLARDLKMLVDDTHRPSRQRDRLGPIPTALRHDISRSALVVGLVSEAYLHSEWCRAEGEWWAKTQRDSGISVEGRVALVRVAPTTAELPAPFVNERGDPLVGFCFYDIERKAPSLPYGWPEPGPLTRDPFRRELLRVVGLMSLRLRAIRDWTYERHRQLEKSTSDQRAEEVPLPITQPTLPTVEEAGRAAAIAAQLRRKHDAREFDVFLCHNRDDQAAVMNIGRKLMSDGLLPWLDAWELRPGLPWQRLLEEQIGSIQSAAVFVGREGIGPWQRQELDLLLREFVRRRCPVIPVMLQETSEEPKLPLFLNGMTWVDFRASEPDPLKQLIWGITGKAPQFF